MRRQLESDYELLGKAFDARIDEVMRVSTGGGGGEALAAVFPVFAKDMITFLHQGLDRQEVRIMERIVTHLDRMHDVHTTLVGLHDGALDRIEALEARAR